MKIEFMTWYEPGMGLVRCAGDDGCGSVLLAGDTEQHLKWHAKVEAVAGLDARRDRVQGVPLTTVIDGPHSHSHSLSHAGCSACGRVKPCGGPHDCARM